MTEQLADTSAWLQLSISVGNRRVGPYTDLNNQTYWLGERGFYSLLVTGNDGNLTMEVNGLCQVLDFVTIVVASGSVLVLLSILRRILFRSVWTWRAKPSTVLTTTP
jgi:hypothetical protein